MKTLGVVLMTTLVLSGCASGVAPGTSAARAPSVTKTTTLSSHVVESARSPETTSPDSDATGQGSEFLDLFFWNRLIPHSPGIGRSANEPVALTESQTEVATGSEGSESTVPTIVIEGDTDLVLVGGGGVSMEQAVQEAKEDLASRLQIDPSGIEVVSSEAVTWNDSSLGCPEKGYSYLQVLTPGYRVVLESGGVQYDYRLDSQGNLKICKG